MRTNKRDLWFDGGDDGAGGDGTGTIILSTQSPAPTFASPDAATDGRTTMIGGGVSSLSIQSGVSSASSASSVSSVSSVSSQSTQSSISSQSLDSSQSSQSSQSTHSLQSSQSSQSSLSSLSSSSSLSSGKLSALSHETPLNLSYSLSIRDSQRLGQQQRQSVDCWSYCRFYRRRTRTPRPPTLPPHSQAQQAACLEW